MAIDVAYVGQRFTIGYAKLKDGSVPAREFLAQQDPRWQARVLSLFQRLGDTGVIQNREHFKKVDNEFWEFKAFQVRMICYFLPGRRVVVTHGFVKKRDVFDKKELKRAQAIKVESESI